MIRKGRMLCFNDGRLVTLDIGEAKDILPIWTTDEGLSAVTGRIPIPPHGFLAATEVCADDEDRLKYAAGGGGMADLTLNWTRLRVVWETDPGFSEKVERGLARLAGGG